MSDTIRGDVKNILLQLKNVSLNKQEQKNSVWDNFSKSLLERYAAGNRK
jgi:hypothetical protein